MELRSPRARGGLLRRAAIASILLAVVIGAAFAHLLVAVEHLRASGQAESRAGRELDSASQLEVLVLEMQDGLRGFVITRDAASLQPFNAARAAFAGQIAGLESHEANR